MGGAILGRRVYPAHAIVRRSAQGVRRMVTGVRHNSFEIMLSLLSLSFSLNTPFCRTPPLHTSKLVYIKLETPYMH